MFILQQNYNKTQRCKNVTKQGSCTYSMFEGWSKGGHLFEFEWEGVGWGGGALI